MGCPHLYESQWKDDDSDDPDVFLLTPIPHPIVAAELEDWQIWLRWERAHHLGETNQDTHPALPEDRPRHEELASELTRHLVTNPTCAVAVNGESDWPRQTRRTSRGGNWKYGGNQSSLAAANFGLQPIWPSPFLPPKLCHHGVAGHVAEPRAVRQRPE